MEWLFFLIRQFFTAWGFGKVNKPYQQDKFEEDCKEAKKMLIQSLQLDDKKDFPISYSLIPDMDHKTWSIQMIYFYEPVLKADIIRIKIPKNDISKYSKFWVGPKSENK